MANVYFSKIDNKEQIAKAAGELWKVITSEEKIEWEKELPIKIHPGAVGNTAFNKPEYYFEVIANLRAQGVDPYYTETCMESSTSVGKLEEFSQHGFNQLPIVIADGESGDDDIEVPITGAKHIKYSLIARKLHEAKQVLVMSHFKGHCMSGYGGAIKMLGIGFTSGRGKTLIHGIKNEYSPGDTIEWNKSHLPGESLKWVKNWDNKYVSSGKIFNERVAESAVAATQNKQCVYITFAVDIVNNCDCDGKAMTPVYKDMGIFASVDPVAIDKAIFDQLEEREKEKPFEGEEILEYAERLGLGKREYNLRIR